MTDNELMQIDTLRKALAFSQGNHHKQCLMQRDAAKRGEYGGEIWNHGHSGAHWQHCHAPSCQAAAYAWRQTKLYTMRVMIFGKTGHGRTYLAGREPKD